MGKLSTKQMVFSRNVAMLILWVDTKGWGVTFGEVARTEYQQRQYMIEGKSKTMNSQHLKRLAVDLNLFVDGEYRTDREAYAPLAEFWKDLHPDNRAGYDWGWDANHFEMKN